MSRSAYSLTKHLACALFVNHDPEHALMVMLTAYFDASEAQKGTRVMTIAGFVSTVKKWEKFEEEWNAVLKVFEVPYLHMKEFNGCTGAFAKWKDRKDRDELKKKLLTALIAVTKRRVHKGFASSVKLADFEEINQDFRLREHWGSEYSFIGMAVVAAVKTWKEKHKRFRHSPIKYIFEDGDKGQGDLKRCLEAENLPYAFTPKKEKQNSVLRYSTQFQIADFAAWENQAVYSRMHDKESRALRQSFRALYKQLPIIPVAFTTKGLRGLGEYRKLNRSASFPSFVFDTHSP